MSMRSNVMTLRTVKRGNENTLTIESNNTPSKHSRISQLNHNHRRYSQQHNIQHQHQQVPKVEQEQEQDNTEEDNNEQGSVKHLDFAPVTLTAAFHDQRVCDDTVVIGIQHLPGAKPGDIAELSPLEGNHHKKLLFVVKQMNEELQRRNKTAQISISSGGSLQSILGFSTRSSVVVKLKDKEEVEADLVEFLVKDVSLNRGDMWELSSIMKGTCVFRSQRLSFMDSIRLTVSSIYSFGKKRFSGYIGDRTKIVFRSESARLVFMIQITEEMYHFQEDGEVMFHKVVNSLFPSIFKRWREEKTHHLITIVFAANVDFSEGTLNDLKLGERPKNTKDYYRVVVDQVNIVHWNEIMVSLRYEFANFRKEIIDYQLKNGISTRNSKFFLPTVKSDILNTINLSTTLVSDRFRDPDLRHTTTHFIVISAGNGLYDVEYKDLLDTSKRLINTELSIDIICLTQPPLHITPLFRYRDDMGNLHHCVPGWIDVSYWTDSTLTSVQWTPSCKIYELQMMGIMENDMNDVTVENLTIDYDASSIAEYMDNYDKSVFGSVKPSTSHPNSNSNSTSAPTTASSIRSTGPRRAPSNASLRWKLSNSAITTIEPETKMTPIFSVSKTAIDSLQEISSPKSAKKRTSSTSLSPVPKTAPSSSGSSMTSSSYRPLRLSSPPIQDYSNRQLKPKNRVFSSVPKSISPPSYEKASAFNSLQTVMWSEIQNISTKVTNLKEFNSLTLGKWQHVFPEGIKRRTIKWRSLLSPSELPVTTPIFPTLDDFEKNFTFQTHSVSLSPEKERILSTEGLFREMIHLRLMMGFQICCGDKVNIVEDKRNFEGDSSLLMKYLPIDDDDIRSIRGSRIYLSLDEEIHRISCDFEGTINVQRYHRSVNQENFYRDHFDRIMIKTRYQHNYHPYDPNTLVLKPKFINWNNYDQWVAGYEDDYDVSGGSESDLRLHRVKFVLLPSEIPKNTTLLNSGNSDNKGEMLTQEELRVEGLRKLIATIHRNAFTPGTTVNKTRAARAQDEALPEINFYTGDLISFLEEQSASSNLDLSLSKTTTRSVSENLLNQDISLGELSKEIQSNRGVKLIDRRWHWKVHKNCFLGFEFVSWLVESFQDIDTREEAVAYGNKLMEQGLFSHVENRHKFLDGYYFYRLEKITVDQSVSSEDLTTSKGRSRSSSVGSKNSNSNSNTKINMTPILQSVKIAEDTPTSSLKKAKSEISNLETPTTPNLRPKSFILSHALKLDLDPNHKSYKPEFLKVHYDTIHNPNHCFHIRLEWLITTPKLIDDTINSWSRMCERYGLKLVETPWNELCEIPRINPFHSYVDIKLAMNPWDPSNSSIYDDLILKSSKFYFHIYLLEYSGFLMDNRASMFFQEDSNQSNFDIRYSWGKPRFKYAQYIHKTGAYIAEIRDTGDLFLAPNNTHIARVNVGNVSIGSNSSSNINSNSILDSQNIMLEFRKTCFDAIKLEEIFLKAKDQWNSNFAKNNEAPRSGVLSPIPDDLTL